MSRLSQEILYAYNVHQSKVFLIAGPCTNNGSDFIAKKMHDELSSEGLLKIGIIIFSQDDKSVNKYDLIKENVKKNDITILSCEDFLRLSFTPMLLTFSNKVIMVVKAGQTRIDDVEVFNKNLKERNVSLLGSVMIYDELPTPSFAKYLEEKL